MGNLIYQTANPMLSSLLYNERRPKYVRLFCTLNNHLNKAKYCLLIQKKIEPKEELFKCDNCEKILSTKQNLDQII